MYTIKESKTEPQAKRNFGEITNNKDFQKRCVDYGKGCAIGLIPANQLQDN